MDPAAEGRGGEVDPRLCAHLAQDAGRVRGHGSAGSDDALHAQEPGIQGVPQQ